MSLPSQAVERLFDRLAATYGTAWVRQWEGVQANAVKSLWSHELAGFAGNLKAIAWALEYLPERCPNLIEFKNLCRLAPAADVPLLDSPKADPARVAAELSKLRGMVDAPAPSAPGPRHAWARAILARRAATASTVSPTVYAMACAALGRSGLEA